MPRRSEIERVASELFKVAHGLDLDDASAGYGTAWDVLACWHLRELRRARGRVVARRWWRRKGNFFSDVPREGYIECLVVLVPGKRRKARTESKR